MIKRIIGMCQNKRWWDSSLNKYIPSSVLLDDIAIGRCKILIISIGDVLCIIPCMDDEPMPDISKGCILEIIKCWESGEIIIGKKGKIYFICDEQLCLGEINLIEGTTNPCFTIDDKYFFKFYRFISASNPEPMIMRKLSDMKCKNIPHVIGWMEYSNNEEYIMAISTRFIKKSIDGIEFFKRYFSDELGVKEATQLGKSLKELHKCMSEIVRCEEVTMDDIKRWKRKIIERTKYGANYIGKIIHEIKKVGSFKCLSHQDMHLGQCIKGDRWYFIDFEGEPLRRSGERVEKLPHYADVASMITSFYYLQEMNKFSLTKANNLIDSFLMGYFGDFKKIDANALTFWLYYRCMYELEYESRFRKNYIFIPLKNIKKIKRKERDVRGSYSSMMAV